MVSRIFFVDKKTSNFQKFIKILQDFDYRTKKQMHTFFQNYELFFF